MSENPSNIPIESRTSNALGVRIPIWIIRQLDKRSEQLLVKNQNTTTPNDNVVFRGNRTSWMRMVSSIDLIDPFKISLGVGSTPFNISYQSLGTNKAKQYFQNMGIDVKDPSDLAKLFVLQGGVSKYAKSEQNTSGFAYLQRSGIQDAYNVAGNSEVEKYGYRPMPGITSIRVQTQGKLGSIRAAEIQLKVWDKAQLDIIDALYFKLGYTMFLEWGHTYYYKSTGESTSAEEYSINPFEPGLSKEDIYNKISNSVRNSEGNYDAMLGVVTNFNFSYNQEGGYDCTIKIISLGVLISNMKMNNPRILPELQDWVVKRLFNTLTTIEKQNILKEQQAAESAARVDPTSESSYPPCVRKYGAPSQLKTGGPYGIRPPKGDQLESYTFYNNGRAVDPEGKTVNYSCDGSNITVNGKSVGITAKNVKDKYLQFYDSATGKHGTAQISFASNVIKTYENADFSANAGDLGWIYFINKLKGFIPIDTNKIDKAQINLDAPAIFKQIDFALSDLNRWKYSVDFGKVIKGFYDLRKPVGSQITNAFNILGDIVELFDSDPNNNGFFDEQKKSSEKTQLNVAYTSKNGNKYNVEIDRFAFGISNRVDVVDNFQNSKTKIAITSGGFGPNTTYSYKLVTNKEFAAALKTFLSDPNKKYKISNVSPRPNEVRISIPLEIPVVKQVDVVKKANVTNALGEAQKSEIVKENVTYLVKTELIIEDSAFITGLTISDSSIQEPIDFLGVSAVAKDANQPADSQAPQEAPSPPAITASDVQKSEAQKYRSAFEVIIRSIQLYSLDNAVTSGIEADHKVKVLMMLEDGKKNSPYKEFTKPLFSVGVFSKIFDKLVSLSKGAVEPTAEVVQACEAYDSFMKTGTFPDKDQMLLIRALFGFHFGLLGNVSTATDLLKNNIAVNYDYLMRSYTVPYEFNQGVFEGTQLNHPVYIPLGLVIMILNHMCTMYDDNKPMVYLDFNHKSNICLSNAKHLSTNPYDVLIPFQGTNKDFESIIEPNTLRVVEVKERSTNKIVSREVVIAPMKDSQQTTPVYTPKNDAEGKDVVKDRISGGLMLFKIGETDVESYRGRTMNILISCDYLLRIVGSFSKSNGSGDVYVKEFIEQILSDINKSLGDINVFRLAYDDGANACHIIDDQMTPNLERRFPVANENATDPNNRSRLPLFGKGSIARTLEIRTEISSKLSNMVAISANASIDNQSELSKSAESFGFYNTAYKDRYVPSRTEFTSSVTLPTDTMIRSAMQFNEAIKTFYGEAKPDQNSVSHATNYYIQRMSKIKSTERGTRAAAMIPVSLNFSIDGMSGFGMGQSFTIDPEFLPYTYDLSLTDPYGNADVTRTVAFIMTGLDHTIENNQWISSVRSNMIYSKDAKDFTSEKLEKLNSVSGLNFTSEDGSMQTGGSGGGNKKECPPCEELASKYKADPGCSRRQPGKVVPSYTFDAVKSTVYKEDNSVESPNKNAGGMKKVVGIVIHHSAGPLSVDISIMKNADGENRVSYHTIIGEDGTRHNFVKDTDRAWHGGCSYIEHPNLPGGSTCNDVNSYFLGLSFVGAPNFVGKGGTRSINIQEIDSAAKWIADKIKKHNIPKDLSTIVTHGIVACGRKDDVVRSVETAIKNRVKQLL